MSRPLSLVAYLALRRGSQPVGETADFPPRPDAPLVWIHSPDATRLSALDALAARLPDFTFLVTTSGLSTEIPPGLLVQPIPADSRPAARAFLDHWQPDLLLWMDGDLRPALLSEAGEENLPRILLEVSAARIGIDGGSWLPGVTKALLALFQQAIAVDKEAAQALRRAGVDPDRITIGDRLDDVAPVLACSERDRADLAQLIGTRPTWLAAEVPPEELDAIIAAHRRASRRAHRLLMILVPRQVEEIGAIKDLLESQDLTYACRAVGQEPDDTTQVYIADVSGEMGLWYRLAPVSYLGGTLTGAAGRHPFEAAALGSAVLHGPRTTPYAAAFERLRIATACRPVGSDVDLGNALELLLSPDRAATLAHAAWEVTSGGAEALNRLIDIIHETLGDEG